MSLPAAEVARPSWSHYYGKPLSWNVHLSNLLHHVPFLLAVRSCHPRRILEVGSGSGSTSILLSRLAPIVSIDLDPVIVNRCQQQSRRFFGRAEYRRGDAFDLSEFASDEFHVVVSQGFFEHFDDENIGRLLNEQLRVGKRVAFSVPNRTYGRQDFGDERLMSRDEWDGLIDGLGFSVETSFDYAPIHRTRTPWRLPRTMYVAIVGK